MRTLQELRDTFGLPAVLTDPEQTDRSVPISKDVVDFVVYLAYPCRVPHALALAPAWVDAPDTAAWALTLTIGPENHTRFNVHFDADGRWQRVEPLSSLHTGNLLLPTPKMGFTAADAAHLMAVQMELEINASSWTSWHSRERRATSTESREASADRVAHLARLRMSEQIRIDALNALAGEHTEEFQRHLEAQKVLRALASDWHEDPRL